MNITFQFADLQAFLWMGGHGYYVWGCYLLTFIGVIFLAVEPGLQKKRLIQQVKSLSRRKSTAQQAE
jgi:heme exporter protein D